MFQTCSSDCLTHLVPGPGLEVGDLEMDGRQPWTQVHGLLAGLFQGSSDGLLTAGGGGGEEIQGGDWIGPKWTEEGGNGQWIDGNKAMFC